MPGRFVPRERKHKRLAKQQSKSTQEDSIDDENHEGANATLLPADASSRRDEKRKRMQNELRPETKMSSKKRKRLDKYIDTKLRKEENLELLKKLEATRVDTSLLQSSRNLGKVHETNRDRLQRALREREAGFDSSSHVLFEPRKESRGKSDSDNDMDDSPPQITDGKEDVPGPSAAEAKSDILFEFGGGLKRPLEAGEGGIPQIKKRKRQKKSKPQSAMILNDGHRLLSDEKWNDDGGVYLHHVEDEWNGFSSNSEASDTKSSNQDNVSETSSVSNFLEAESEGDDGSAEDNGADSERVFAFRQWADSQRNAAVGFTPSSLPTEDVAIVNNFKPRAPSPDSLMPVVPESTTPTGPRASLTISRTDDVQTDRLKLPVVQEEQRIVEAVHNNPVVVICGATGSGKTTQVPQMLFENGYGSFIGSKAANGKLSDSHPPQSFGMVGITQPRRVAATSVANRVAFELGDEYKTRVAHQVRYDSNVSRSTAIKFMTDGILLREIQQDFILSKYSAIILDEAHERSVNTDILIGILSRIVNLREELAREQSQNHYPLKLVIMSATLRINDFLTNDRLFKGGAPPIIEAEGRQYPVTVHFSRRTRRDYTAEAVEKVAKAHRKLPAGGILVFLTAQQEIHSVIKQLQERIGSSSVNGEVSNSKNQKSAAMLRSSGDLDSSLNSRTSTEFLDEEDELSDSDILVQVDEDDEFVVETDLNEKGSNSPLKPHILPLYAALPASQQARVFEPTPDDHRTIIVTTNVAETSLTIPGIRYVFDCGRSKEKRCDTVSNVQTFEIDWISKASALQRTGRAGRTGPGHCYRLYSSALFENHFEEHTVPEILRTPLESTVLQLKAMNIDNVVNFPFPTPPDRLQLSQANGLLVNLGAISASTGKITSLGRDLVSFPLNPRYGKMLMLASRNKLIDKTVALVAGLAVGDLYIPEIQSSRTAEADQNKPEVEDKSRETPLENWNKTQSEQRHQAYTRAQATLSRWDRSSDSVKLLTAVAAHAEAVSKSSDAGRSFCADYFLREKGMQEVQQLRQQLHSIATKGLQLKDPTQNPLTLSSVLSLPNESERTMLNQVVAAGFIDQVAVRADLLPHSSIGFSRKPRRATEVPYRTLLPLKENINPTSSSESQEFQKSAFVHPSSILAKLGTHEMPHYVVYSHLSRAAPSASISSESDSGLKGGNAKRTRIHPLTTLGPKTLATLAEGTPMLRFGKPIGKIEELVGKRRQCWVSISLKAPFGEGAVSDGEWPLGAWKVLQKRGSKDWEVEKVVSR